MGSLLKVWEGASPHESAGRLSRRYLGERAGKGLPVRGLWGGQQLGSPSYMDKRLVIEAGKKAQGHLLEDTGYHFLNISALSLPAKAKQTRRAVRSHGEPCRQQDGAKKGSV